MELEDVFSSKPRIKILKILHTLGSLNISEIARKLKMNFASTAQHLTLLESEKILQVHLYGRVKLYRINEASPKAKAIIQLIDIWEQNK